GLISIDEAHFSAASSYRTICQYFDQSIVAFFTGSKFRSDGQPLPYVKYREIEDRDELGRTIVKYAPIADYEFTIQNAWSLNPPPIKRICLYEATSSGFLILENGTETEYKLD
ncbi:MAG TPA: restriction endonuclease subunit R, partial [Cyanobacteria bacterium UBA8553]|nr:restriction endonuclease subunit R [Cyanobacteria bacterium UBA8553]